MHGSTLMGPSMYADYIDACKCDRASLTPLSRWAAVPNQLKCLGETHELIQPKVHTVALQAQPVRHITANYSLSKRPSWSCVSTVRMQPIEIPLLITACPRNPLDLI